MTTGTEWHFIIYTPDGIYSTSGSKYQINLTKSAVKDNPELLRSNVKRVIGITVGLLKDRVLGSKNILKNNIYDGLCPDNCIYFSHVSRE